ncbi:MAG: c-di-GMP-related signal transduction protein [Paraglaciecola sp.]
MVDNKQATIGFKLLLRDSQNNCFPDINPDEATSKLLTQRHLTTGVEVISNGKWVL